MAYKRAILAKVEQCTEPSAVGALLRQEGPYSSQLSQWRQEQQVGELKGSSSRKRGSNRIVIGVAELVSWVRYQKAEDNVVKAANELERRGLTR